VDAYPIVAVWRFENREKPAAGVKREVAQCLDAAVGIRSERVAEGETAKGRWTCARLRSPRRELAYKCR
jgi:hypothetical protein